jgi:hypothetical protein
MNNLLVKLASVSVNHISFSDSDSNIDSSGYRNKDFNYIFTMDNNGSSANDNAFG